MFIVGKWFKIDLFFTSLFEDTTHIIIPPMVITLSFVLVVIETLVERYVFILLILIKCNNHCFLLQGKTFLPDFVNKIILKKIQFHHFEMIMYVLKVKISFFYIEKAHAI